MDTDETRIWKKVRTEKLLDRKIWSRGGCHGSITLLATRGPSLPFVLFLSGNFSVRLSWISVKLDGYGKVWSHG
jgi:hypothetical protein